MNLALDSPIVRRAAEVCVAAHAGQSRDDGRPYATHPQAVADCLVAHGIRDLDVLAAAYLHDVLEDTPVTAAQLESEFGPQIVGVVSELTNVGPPDRPFAQKHAALLQHARHMSPQARLVKLADRLHNLSEMAAWPDWKQARYAKAALELADALEPSPSATLSGAVRLAADAALRRLAAVEPDSSVG